ncbi:MAG: peroxiredoxin family protein, partial [Gemmatimonadota bacterium]
PRRDEPRRRTVMSASIRQWMVAFGVLLVLGGALAWGALHTSRGVEVGDLAPAYAARALDGDTVHLADLRGRPVLLNVWATWCGPCRVEMPSIQRLYDAYRDRGFVVLAVSVDAAHAEPAIRDFVEEYGLTFPVLHDPESRVSEVFRTRGVPETLVLDAAGTIVKRFSGSADWDSPANHVLIEHLLDAR